jgi:hypothetical protein
MPEKTLGTKQSGGDNFESRKSGDNIGPRREFLILSKCLKRMAGTTRLELATSAVTGQRSNQLNYVPTGVYKALLAEVLKR